LYCVLNSESPLKEVPLYMLYLPIPAISYMAVVCVVFRVCTCSALYYHIAGVVGMAEQALGALKWMKAGLNVEKSRDKKKGKVRKMSVL